MAELKEARVPDIGGYDGVPVIELSSKRGTGLETWYGFVRGDGRARLQPRSGGGLKSAAS